MLTFEEYCQLAARTAPQDDLMNAVLGLLGEGGEIADLIKKSRYQGHALDVAKLQEEIGDALWYLAMLARSRGLQSYHFWVDNAIDPSNRLPDGVFNALWGYFDSVVDIMYRSNMRTEVFWELLTSLNTFAAYHDLTLEQCAVANIEKLRRRYPDGFSAEASINREV